MTARGFPEEAGTNGFSCVHHIGSKAADQLAVIAVHIEGGEGISAARHIRGGRAVSGNSANRMEECSEVRKALHKGSLW